MVASDDIEEAVELFQDHAEQLGFINEARVEEGPLYVEKRDGEVVGAALANHLSSRAISYLRDIVVKEEYRREGIAESLVEQIREDSPHPVLKAKCPEDLPANDFYDETGWQFEEVEEVGGGKNLNIWSIGRPDTDSAADASW